VLAGLRSATRSSQSPASVAIDSWGVDYGLVDESGALVGEPYSYRDDRTAGTAAATHARIDPARLYAINGLQELPFTTIYQLAAEQGTGRLERASSMLLIADLLGFWLTGERVAEATNASTTGLFNATHATWSAEVADAVGLDERLLPPLREPGRPLGPLRADVAAEMGLPTRLQAVLVGSHDTASAVVGVPAEGDAWAYLSCGTWSLVGLELERPLVSDRSRAANFTNERGVGGTIRYLRNVMGLWLLQESVRTWQQHGLTDTLPALVDRSGDMAPGGPVFDVDDAVFLPPGDMPTRIQDACLRCDQPVPTEPVAIVRCILDGWRMPTPSAWVPPPVPLGAASDVRRLRLGRIIPLRRGSPARLAGRSPGAVLLPSGASGNGFARVLLAGTLPCQRPAFGPPVPGAGRLQVLCRPQGSDVRTKDSAV